MGVAGEPAVLEREHGSGEVVAAAEAQELVFAERLVPIGARSRFDQPRELFEVLTIELAEDPSAALLYYRGGYGSLA